MIDQWPDGTSDDLEGTSSEKVPTYYISTQLQLQ